MMAKATGIYIHSSKWGYMFPLAYHSYNWLVSCASSFKSSRAICLADPIIQPYGYLFCHFSLLPRHDTNHVANIQSVKFGRDLKTKESGEAT